MEYYKIVEIFDGHYQVLLDSFDKLNLFRIIDRSYKYVWGIGHIENAVEWANYNDSLYRSEIDTKVLARNISMEYLLKTEDFLKLVPSIHQTVKIIQTNIEPPYFLTIERLTGKGKYDLLRDKINYLFELEMPGASDYSTIISPDKMFLEALIKEFS